MMMIITGEDLTNRCTPSVCVCVWMLMLMLMVAKCRCDEGADGAYALTHSHEIMRALLYTESSVGFLVVSRSDANAMRCRAMDGWIDRKTIMHRVDDDDDAAEWGIMLAAAAAVSWRVWVLTVCAAEHNNTHILMSMFNVRCSMCIHSHISRCGTISRNILYSHVHYVLLSCTFITLHTFDYVQFSVCEIRWTTTRESVDWTSSIWQAPNMTITMNLVRRELWTRFSLLLSYGPSNRPDGLAAAAAAATFFLMAGVMHYQNCQTANYVGWTISPHKINGSWFLVSILFFYSK